MDLDKEDKTKYLSEQLISALSSDQQWQSAGDGGDGSAIVQNIQKIFSELDKQSDLKPAIPLLINTLLDDRILFKIYDYRECTSVSNEAQKLLLKSIDQALPHLFSWIDSGSQQQINAAVSTLMVATSRILPIIIEHMRTVTPDQQIRYFRILNNFPGTVSAEVFLDLLESTDSKVVSESVRSLGWIFSARYRSWLSEEGKEQQLKFFKEKVYQRLHLLSQSQDKKLRRIVKSALAEIGLNRKESPSSGE
jgi:hypothetical protein